ncbi:Uncharacterised protein [Vibrio cholerae]|nr:Uncharacterised protein [Vibrio cholerae]
MQIKRGITRHFKRFTCSKGNPVSIGDTLNSQRTFDYRHALWCTSTESVLARSHHTNRTLSILLAEAK